MERHRIDLVSLFFGLLFVGLAVTGMFGDEGIAALEARWVWPVLLVAGGLAIVGFSVGRSSRRADGDAGMADVPHDPVD